MLRTAIVGLAAGLLVGMTFIPDDALAYRGGARAGGGVRAAGVRGGAVGVAGRGVAYRGAAVGVAGRGVAYRGAAYRGGYYPYRGAAIVLQRWEPRQSAPPLTATTTTATATTTQATTPTVTATAATRMATATGSASSISLDRGMLG